MIISKKFLIIVLPLIVESMFAKGVKTRSYLAFPYGPLTIGSYIKKNSEKHQVHILVLNLYQDDQRGLLDVINDKIEEFAPDIVGMSMMFDQSYKHVDQLASLIKQKNE